MITYKAEGRYRVEVLADSSGKFVGNGLRFDSIYEATDYAIDLTSRWTSVRAWRVVDGNDGLIVASGAV